jgi:hypothetical protein
MRRVTIKRHPFRHGSKEYGVGVHMVEDDSIVFPSSAEAVQILPKPKPKAKPEPEPETEEGKE